MDNSLSIVKFKFFSVLVFFILNGNINDFVVTDPSESHNVLRLKQKDANIQRTFVHSCGSGCAMSYKEIDLKILNNAHEVKLKVTMYVNEEVTDEFFLKYIIDCNSNMASSMISKENGENVFTTGIKEIENVFKEYADKVCSSTY